MKNWFPFTDYDFYAYLTAGLIVLFALDYGFGGNLIVSRENWPFIHVVFVIAMAYLVGQIIAGTASIVLEHWIARRILRPPIAVMMGLGKMRCVEAFIGRWLIGRYYEPESENRRSIILKKVAKKLGKRSEDIDDPEDVFQVAFPVARAIRDSADRMDNFRNLYGFSRNSAFAGLISAGAFVYRAVVTDENGLYWWVLVIILLSFGMYVRFLKFYAAYSAEVLRTFASICEEKIGES